MSNTQTRLIAIGCLLSGIFVGVAGAQVAETLQQRFLNSGLFAVTADERANFHVTLDDQRGAPPALVRLQILDQNGVVVARREVTLLPGQSASLAKSGPGLFRAHAEVVESGLLFTKRRTTVGSVEVIDDLKGVIRPSCPLMYDPFGQGGGRN